MVYKTHYWENSARKKALKINVAHVKSWLVVLMLSVLFQRVKYWMEPEVCRTTVAPSLILKQTHQIMFLASQAVFVCLFFSSSSFKLCKHSALINLLSCLCQKINPASAQHSHQLTHRANKQVNTWKTVATCRLSSVKITHNPIICLLLHVFVGWRLNKADDMIPFFVWHKLLFCYVTKESSLDLSSSCFCSLWRATAHLIAAVLFRSNFIAQWP